MFWIKNRVIFSQDEPLTIRIMDYDTYSANDAIGKVYIDLNPLLWPSNPTPVKKDPADGSAKDDSNKHPGKRLAQLMSAVCW